MANVLSTRDLADAIGASESSIKRWVDAGTIRASRTAGGHRRISREEAIRFIRESGTPVVRPQILGLDDAAAATQRTEEPISDEERLFTFLRDGASAAARGVVQSLYVNGHSPAAIADGPLRGAMRRIGELWRHDPDGILCEHRATDICIQAIAQLRLMLPEHAKGPLAVGGAPAGDPYILPSLLAATTLTAEGFRTVNLGPSTPLATIARAVDLLQPVLVWITVSARLGTDVFDSIVALADSVRPRGVSVVVGGRMFPEGPAPAAPNLHVGRSMVELAAFARGLLAPRRGAEDGA